jgi:hypothetical protein
MAQNTTGRAHCKIFLSSETLQIAARRSAAIRGSTDHRRSRE